MRRVFSILTAAAGAAALLLGLGIWAVSGFHIGHGMMVVLGLALIVWGSLGEKRRRVPLWIRVTAYTLLACEIVFAGSLLVYGVRDTADGSEDAIIVLGAGLRPGTDQVNSALEDRLTAALAYCTEYPDTVVVMSGGQEGIEIVTEASAMAKWWTAHGGDPDRLLLEEASASTRENFRFSKALLDEYFSDGYTAACVTSHYHCYRAERIAGLEGLSVTHVSAGIGPTLVPANTLRETAAVVKFWLWDRFHE